MRDPERLLEAVGQLAKSLDEGGNRVACSTVMPTSGTSFSMRSDDRACWIAARPARPLVRGRWLSHRVHGLSPGERQETETDLLAHYLDRLGGEGVEVPSLDAAMRSIGARPALRVLPLGNHPEGSPSDYHRDARAARHCGLPITRPIRRCLCDLARRIIRSNRVPMELCSHIFWCPCERLDRTPATNQIHSYVT